MNIYETPAYSQMFVKMLKAQTQTFKSFDNSQSPLVTNEHSRNKRSNIHGMIDQLHKIIQDASCHIILKSQETFNH